MLHCAQWPEYSLHINCCVQDCADRLPLHTHCGGYSSRPSCHVCGAYMKLTSSPSSPPALCSVWRACSCTSGALTCRCSPLVLPLDSWLPLCSCAWRAKASLPRRCRRRLLRRHTRLRPGPRLSALTRCRCAAPLSTKFGAICSCCAPDGMSDVAADSALQPL